MAAFDRQAQRSREWALTLNAHAAERKRPVVRNRQAKAETTTARSRRMATIPRTACGWATIRSL
jgi:hypothetical protein